MEQNIPLITKLGKLCVSKSLRLVSAESCTGGGVAYAFTSIAGSSIWFERGFVTYSNASKIELLGVSTQTLDRYGAVSQQVACEMAEGALKNSHADVSLAITGIAGPEGGTEDKPVGTCWFAWASHSFATKSKQEIFVGDRNSIRSQAITFILKELLTLIDAISK